MSQPANNSFDFSGLISALYVYPIKSCAGVQLQEVIVTETGFEFDRAWMVVNDKGAFLSQRELPQMALIQPQLKHCEMVLRAPGMLALHIKLDEVESPARVRVWGDEVAAFDMGALAAQWLTDYLGIRARLVRFDPAHQRASAPDWTQGIHALNQFSDGFPLLVVSQASLNQLNDKLAAKGSPAVSMSRFRPNIVLGSAADAGEPGAMTAHDEDRLDVLHISTGQGSLQLKLVKPCARCSIPNIDPVTALSTHDVGDMLQTYRSDPRVAGALTFGMNAVVVEGFEQTLKTGQQVLAHYTFE